MLLKYYTNKRNDLFGQMVISNGGVYEVICFVVQVGDTRMLILQARGTDDCH